MAVVVPMGFRGGPFDTPVDSFLTMLEREFVTRDSEKRYQITANGQSWRNATVQWITLSVRPDKGQIKLIKFGPWATTAKPPPRP